MAERQTRGWLRLNPGKWLFSVILFFNIGWFLAEKPSLLPNLLVYFFFPFVLIWYADAIGESVRFTPQMRRAVRMPLPVFIRIVGWVLLVIPFIWVVLLSK